MTKAFLMFLMVALVLGGMLGGSFAGGVALGKIQGQNSAEVRGPSPSPVASGRPASGGSNFNPAGARGDPSSPGGFGQRSPQGSGPGGSAGGGQPGVAPGGGDPQAPGGRFQGRPADGSGGQGGFLGTIKSVDGNNLRLETPQGPVEVTLGPDTKIQRVVEGSTEDLKAEVTVRVMGQRGEYGDVQARGITLVPEGAEGGFGGRGTDSGH